MCVHVFVYVHVCVCVCVCVFVCMCVCACVCVCMRERVCVREREVMKVVRDTKSFHVVVIVADGQVCAVTVQHAATHCSTLQHSAAHCNIPKNTTTQRWRSFVTPRAFMFL